MTPEEMTVVARSAARLIDLPGGYAVLDEELRKRGYTLAAVLVAFMSHDMHIVMGEPQPDCQPCMEALYPA